MDTYRRTFLYILFKFFVLSYFLTQIEVIFDLLESLESFKFLILKQIITKQYFSTFYSKRFEFLLRLGHFD